VYGLLLSKLVFVTVDEILDVLVNKLEFEFNIDILAVFVSDSFLLYVVLTVDVLVLVIDLVLVGEVIIERVLAGLNVGDFVCVIDLVLDDELVIDLVEELERVEVDDEVILLLEKGLAVFVTEGFILLLNKLVGDDVELDVSLLLGFWLLLVDDDALEVLEERDDDVNDGVFVFELLNLDVNVVVLDCVRLLEDVVLAVCVCVFAIEEVHNALDVSVLEDVDVRVDVLDCKLLLVEKILLVSMYDG